MAGASDILDHRLSINASAYLPNRRRPRFPNGIVQPVDDTPFDFRLARTIRADGEQDAVRQQSLPGFRAPSAERRQPGRERIKPSIEMEEMWTTEPGVQFSWATR